MFFRTPLMRLRSWCLLLLMIFVGFYSYIANWCLLLRVGHFISGEGIETREYIEEFLPQFSATSHKQVYCTPWQQRDMETPPPGPDYTQPVKWRGVRQSTSPFDSTVHILDWKHQYNICDKIKAKIEVRDWRNQTKSYGGDYIRASISSLQPLASANADYLLDFDNGTYMAYFTVRWPATNVEVTVTMVHPREAVDILERIRERVPNRFAYTGRFNRKGNKHFGENVACHITNADKRSCNLSDSRVHAPWYCERPPSSYNLTCEDYTWHKGNNQRANEEAGNLVTDNEAWLFYLQKEKLNFRDMFNVSGTMLGATDDFPIKFRNHRIHRFCSFGLMPTTFQSSGYFYNEVWYSNNCKIHSFKATEALTCLQNKLLHFYGDSTVRQLYEFFVNRCWKTFHEVPIRTSKFWKVGPSKAYDAANNITLLYQHHGLPIRNNWTWTKDIRYIANELDDLRGGRNVVVVISLWAHFTATSLEFFERRIRDIKAAIQRLWERSPDTYVIIKGANTRGHSGLSNAIYSSDWYAMHLEDILRKVFEGEERLGYIDVWDMTTAHHKSDDIHPSHEVVANIVNRLLTYVCL